MSLKQWADNGWLRPQELLLRADSSVELIRRAETDG